MQKKLVALTGIKPTGTPHIGNYFGAIKPALELAKDYEARYFIADYHALNQIKDRDTLIQYTYEVAATWLACGLDPEKILFYRQSQVPEIFELTQILAAFTPKGLMNRAHAYKAKVEENKEKGRDLDYGVNMGLYTYPILMAADILIFDTNIVPVGRDQKQHVEMARDIAEYVNKNYKKDLLVLPEPLIREETDIIVGLDGRKMSKSYNNTIPLFDDSKKLRKKIMKIVTNSQTIEEPKDPDQCNIFALYKLFATKEEQEALRKRYLQGGMGWGEAKQALYEVMERTLAPMREKYYEYLENKDYIDKVLDEGSQKAREIAHKTLLRVKKAIGVIR